MIRGGGGGGSGSGGGGGGGCGGGGAVGGCGVWTIHQRVISMTIRNHSLFLSRNIHGTASPNFIKILFMIFH